MDHPSQLGSSKITNGYQPVSDADRCIVLHKKSAHTPKETLGWYRSLYFPRGDSGFDWFDFPISLTCSFVCMYPDRLQPGFGARSRRGGTIFDRLFGCCSCAFVLVPAIPSWLSYKAVSETWHFTTSTTRIRSDRYTRTTSIFIKKKPPLNLQLFSNHGSTDSPGSPMCYCCGRNCECLYCDTQITLHLYSGWKSSFPSEESRWEIIDISLTNEFIWSLLTCGKVKP